MKRKIGVRRLARNAVPCPRCSQKLSTQPGDAADAESASSVTKNKERAHHHISASVVNCTRYMQRHAHPPPADEY